MYYFAYGSNMNLEQMKFRCSGAMVVGPATLPGFGLRERQYADIDRSPAETVHGVLWRITAPDLAALDRYEGFPRFYIRHTVTVFTADRREYPALVYEMTEECKASRKHFPYSAEYRQVCSAGATANGIHDAFR